MAKKKEVKSDLEVNLPDNYSGEVVISRAHAVPTYNIVPIEQHFGNGELNLLKDKINEIIKIITG